MKTLPLVEPGDVLAYWRVRSIFEELIDAGETLEDGRQAKEYYHVSVALNGKQQIEALTSSGVGIHPIIYDGSFDVFKVPVSKSQRDRGLGKAVLLDGNKYNWWAVVDDALGMLTFDSVRLPKRFMRKINKYLDDCSQVALAYLRGCKWKPALKFKTRITATPQDIVNLLKPFQ